VSWSCDLILRPSDPSPRRIGEVSGVEVSASSLGSRKDEPDFKGATRSKLGFEMKRVRRKARIWIDQILQTQSKYWARAIHVTLLQEYFDRVQSR
jgi:hypothetical protein